MVIHAAHVARVQNSFDMVWNWRSEQHFGEPDMVLYAFFRLLRQVQSLLTMWKSRPVLLLSAILELLHQDCVKMQLQSA